MTSSHGLSLLVLCATLLAACGDSSQPVAPPPEPSTADAPSPPSDPLAAPLSEDERSRIATAQQALLAGLPEQVHAILGTLLEREPVPADVQFVAGSAAYDLHQYGEAVTRLTDAVLQRPIYLPNSSALGFAHLKLGDFEAAREAFSRIVEADPQKYKAHYGLGLVALALGDLPAARTSLSESLRLSPDYLKAMFAMARLLDAEGRPEEALATVTIVTSRWPSHDEALYLMGRLLASQGRDEDAAEVFARHELVYSVKESLAGLGAQLGTATDGPVLRLQMVELHLSIGDVGEAGRSLSAALLLYPDDPALLMARQQFAERG